MHSSTAPPLFSPPPLTHLLLFSIPRCDVGGHRRRKPFYSEGLCSPLLEETDLQQLA
ncbi:UNVERIFIED_CONTAM: hypothetical protein Sangu_1803600 [Sesamum angustifolium]|uniref:Uncharacterized protein n=1 Tax=Sesamum angustifolium TaxID=2727405 RepID=A0AAW2M7W7_9LAMI